MHNILSLTFFFPFIAIPFPLIYFLRFIALFMLNNIVFALIAFWRRVSIGNVTFGKSAITLLEEVILFFILCGNVDETVVHVCCLVGCHAV
jgi:hypothetical protein